MDYTLGITRVNAVKKLTDWQLIEDTNSAEIVSDPYRRTQQDKEMDKAHFLLDLNKNLLIRFLRTEVTRTYVRRHSCLRIVMTAGKKRPVKIAEITKMRTYRYNY